MREERAGEKGGEECVEVEGSVDVVDGTFVEPAVYLVSVGGKEGDEKGTRGG